MSIKESIANALSCNTNLNKKALCLKKSWDEVSKILNMKPCNKECKKPNKKK